MSYNENDIARDRATIARGPCNLTDGRILSWSDAAWVVSARQRWPAALDEVARLRVQSAIDGHTLAEQHGEIACLRAELAVEKRRVEAMLAAGWRELASFSDPYQGEKVMRAVERAAKETP